MEEYTSLEADILENIRATSEALIEQNAGSDSRLTEAKIYDMQVKEINEHYRILNENDINQERLGLERYKIDEEMKLRREIEEAKLEIDRSKAKTEKGTMIGKLILETLTAGIYTGFGFLYLKANLKYGGMIGKDAKNWFDDLKRIKL